MQYFKLSEFRCKCQRDICDAEHMHLDTVMMLVDVRKDFGQPMTVTSARRCEYWNKKVGGADNSWHLRGRAVDIACPDGIYMAWLVRSAIKCGFTGIGVSKGFVHLDTRPGQLVMFGY